MISSLYTSLYFQLLLDSFVLLGRYYTSLYFCQAYIGYIFVFHADVVYNVRMARRDNYKGPLFIVAASVCWSFGGLCIKFIPWGALTINGLRAFFAAIVFGLYRRSARVRLTKGNIIAAICLCATTNMFVLANKLTTAAAAILLQYCMPVFIVLIELFFYKKKPRLVEIAAVLATLLGMTLFFGDRLEAGAMLGNLLAVASGLAFAGVFVCNSRPDVDPEHSLFLGFIINSAIGLPFAIFDVTPDPLAWTAVIFLGSVQVGVAYIFFTTGIKSTSALLAGLISALEPVLNPVWVALFTGEVPGPFATIGGGIILLTVISYNIWAERASRAAT